MTTINKVKVRANSSLKEDYKFKAKIEKELNNQKYTMQGIRMVISQFLQPQKKSLRKMLDEVNDRIRAKEIKANKESGVKRRGRPRKDQTAVAAPKPVKKLVRKQRKLKLPKQLKEVETKEVA